jgi:hypothetical protein
MMFDIAREVGATTRTVVDLEHEGQPAKAVIAARTYDTTLEDLWDAITNGDRLPRWFLPISGDLRLGGRYQLKGNAGGTITRCEPPRHLGVTWEFGGDVTWLNVTLSEDAKGARLELQHIARPGGEHWEKFGPGAVGIGWDLGLIGLGRHISPKATVDHAAAEAWAASPEGKDFMRKSGDDWGRAAIAGGASPEIALAQAARTVAFYTGG